MRDGAPASIEAPGDAPPTAKPAKPPTGPAKQPAFIGDVFTPGPLGTSEYDVALESARRVGASWVFAG
jgi:hypothetical protein